MHFDQWISSSEIEQFFKNYRIKVHLLVTHYFEDFFRLFCVACAIRCDIFVSYIRNHDRHKQGHEVSLVVIQDLVARPFWFGVKSLKTLLIHTLAWLRRCLSWVMFHAPEMKKGLLWRNLKFGCFPTDIVYVLFWMMVSSISYVITVVKWRPLHYAITIHAFNFV